MPLLTQEQYVFGLNSNKTFKRKVAGQYWNETQEDGIKTPPADYANWSKFDKNGVKYMWDNHSEDFLNTAYDESIDSRNIEKPNSNIAITSGGINNQQTSQTSQQSNQIMGKASPFDIRLSRIMLQYDETISKDKIYSQTPFSGVMTSVDGLFASEETIDKFGQDSQAMAAITEAGETVATLQEKVKGAKASLQSSDSDLYRGTPSLINTYALTKLYGSKGGEYLINQKGKRKWYEIDWDANSTNTKLAYSMNPTTSSIILWGNEDPYGRLPFHFTDFVFCKYWTKIPNNRLIVLRRYPGPILDNLNFIGMDGDDINSTTNKISLPPMATAITYFGEGTDNDFNKILKFSTGVNWGEAKADVWQVNSTATPDNEAGPGGLGADGGILRMFGGVGGLAKTLSIGEGTNNNNAVLNKGEIPPDPYHDGPYENRILGPVNRINTVKKRDPGLKFEMSGLDIKFTYVARPIGGINTKAVILDILSNFLVMGSASAVFFGGQHRFMAKPIKYPFAGGKEGMKNWYSGKPVEWGKNAVQQFVGQGSSIFQNIMDMFKQIIGNIGDGQGLNSILGTIGDTKNASGRYIQNWAAEKSKGEIPYLTGFKALLTGEPVGDWHITIGNPFNPIAMIGNLICQGVEVEFGNEIGPDDFPLEITFTVKLEHGMPRDKDSIQSMFNRGMGRIYAVPDEFKSSADFQTVVDKYTQQYGVTGNNPTPFAVMGYAEYGGFSKQQISSVVNANVGKSVWKPISIKSISPNMELDFTNQAYKSAFRKIDWIKLRALT
jgi:hypothetical protein